MGLTRQNQQPPRPSRGGSRLAERGFVLIAVLWLGLGIAAVASFLAVAAQFQARQARASLDRAVTEVSVLDAAAAWTVTALAEDAPEAIELGDAPLWKSFAGRRVGIRVSATTGFVDINGDDPARIAQILTEAGIPPDEASGFAARIVDFRDPDDLRQLNGAEAEDYRAAGLPPPRNGPFLAPSELALVLDAQPELLTALEPRVLALEAPSPEGPQKVAFIGGRPTDVSGKRAIAKLRRPDFIVTLILDDRVARRFAF